MDEKKASLIAKEILKLRKDGDLKLTMYGAVTLSPFPAKVILKARDKFRQTRGKGVNMLKPFNYFLALCMHVAQELGISPDWDKNEQLCEYYSVIGGIRVTEDDEFLSDSPPLVKQAIDAQVRLLQNPSKRHEKNKAAERGPKFDGSTYTYRGKACLRPQEGKEWINPEIEKRLDQSPGYWEEEKRKFLEMAKQGKVNSRGLKFLVAEGFLTADEIKDVEPLVDM